MALAQAKATNKVATPQRVSFNPDTQTTGFFDDVDGEITDAQTCMFDYNGQQPEQPALALEITDPNGAQHSQYWACGKTEDWSPTDDNTGFVSKSGKTGFSSQSNIAMLFKSMVEAGGDAVLPILNSGDVKQLIGLKAHWIVKPVERKGLVRTPPKAGQTERASGVLIVSKIHSLPGTQSNGKAATGTSAKPVGDKPNGAASPQTAAAASADDYAEIDPLLIEGLTADLAKASENTLPKKVMIQIAGRVFNTEQLKSRRSMAITRASSQAFLGSLAASGIIYNGTQFTLEQSQE